MSHRKRWAPSASTSVLRLLPSGLTRVGGEAAHRQVPVITTGKDITPEDHRREISQSLWKYRGQRDFPPNTGGLHGTMGFAVGRISREQGVRHKYRRWRETTPTENLCWALSGKPPHSILKIIPFTGITTSNIRSQSQGNFTGRDETKILRPNQPNHLTRR